MAALVEVLSVNHGRQGQGNAWKKVEKTFCEPFQTQSSSTHSNMIKVMTPKKGAKLTISQLLLVTKTKLAGVVDLGTD